MQTRLGFSRQLLLFTLVLLALPVLLTFYMLHMMERAEQGMVQADRAKLEHAMRVLDQHFRGTFDDILREHNVPDDARNRDKVRVLNGALAPVIDGVARDFPGVELGLYCRDLDVIVNGHTETYGENFGTRRKKDIERAAVAGEPVSNVVGLGGSGGLIETYRPLVRDGRVIGAVVAQENTKDIYRRLARVRQEAYLTIIGGIVIGVGGFFFLLNRFLDVIGRVKEGLTNLENDLSYRLPLGSGEMQEIAHAINHLAARLEEMRSYNEIILDSVDTAIMAVDNDGRVVLVNPPAFTLLNLGDVAVQGHTLAEVFVSRPDDPVREILERAVQGRETVRDLTLRLEAPDGPRFLVVGTSLLTNQRGEMMGVVLTARDVTERRRLEERVKRQERLAALGKFVAGVAHEIRNPLTSISGYIQHWQRRGQTTPESLTTVGREVTRLNNIVDKLLFFARPAQMRLQEYSVNALVQQVLSFFGEAHSNSVRIGTCLAPDLPLARLDPEAMKQVLMNILYNSYQAMPEGGFIQVDTGLSADGRYLVVTVADTGVGIPAENLSRIFDPFFTTRPRGSGLGLALAHEIVEAHGGYIEVESTVGKGTTMRVYIPRWKEGEGDAAGAGR